MMLPVILALLFYLDYEEKRGLLFLFASGLLSAAAFFTKGTAIFSVLVIPLFIVYRNIANGTPDLKSFFKEAAFYSLGVFSIVAALTLYFMIHGAVRDFYYTYFVINGLYTGAVPLTDAFVSLMYFIYGSIVWSRDFTTLLTAVSSFIILLQLLRRKFGDEEKRSLLFIAALTVLSLLGVLWGRRMFPHYYLQMALAYSLLIALGISKLELDRKYIRAAIVIITALFLIEYPITQTTRQIKNRDIEWFEADTSYAVAGYIRRNTSEDESILVIGGQPVIQFLSDRRAPIKDFWWPNHHEVLFDILKLKDTVPGALDESKPEYIAFYDGKHEGQITHIGYIDEFINDNYNLEKEIGGYKLYRLKE
jgi:hypothetical protein